MLQRARPHPGRRRTRRAQHPLQRQPRLHPQVQPPVALRPGYRVLLLHLRHQRRGELRERHLVGQRREALRRPDHRPTGERRPQGRQRAADAELGGPAGRVRRARGAAGQHQGRGRGARPRHRRHSRHGVDPELRPEPAVDPRRRRSQPELGPAQRQPDRADAQPSDAGDLPTWFDVQGGRVGGRVGQRVLPRQSRQRQCRPRPAAVHQCAAQPEPRRLRWRADPVDAGAGGLVQRGIR